MLDNSLLAKEKIDGLFKGSLDLEMHKLGLSPSDLDRLMFDEDNHEEDCGRILQSPEGSFGN